MSISTPPPRQKNPVRTGAAFLFFYLALGVLSTQVIYIVLLNLAILLFPHLIIFFFSCVLIAMLGVIFFLLSYYLLHCGLFMSFSMMLNLCLFLFVFSVFGPVFIDRSISYHVAFIAGEEGEIDPQQLEQAWSHSIIQKRLDDGVSAGMLQKVSSLHYIGTPKSKIFTKIMISVGQATRTLQSYRLLKESYDAKITP